MEIKKEEMLIAYLTKPENLWFGTKSIKNPFRSKNVLKRYVYNKQLTVKDNILLSRLNMKKTNIVKAIDFWINKNNDDLDKFYMEQICYICKVIKRYLGENIEWIIDVSDPIFKLFTSFPFIQSKFLNTLNIKTNLKQEFIKDLNYKLQIEWTPIICDAVMNDATDTDRYVFNKSKMMKGFDEYPTGSVYADKYNFQVNLDGAFYKKSGEMFYKLNGQEMSDTVKYNSISAAITTINNTLKQYDKKYIDEEECHKEILTALANKRSGDWGMVENCVVKRRAFMTQDKLAALYAIYRKVPVIYVHPVLRHKEIDQYTFVLVK
jgi:hypothetical protein